MRKIKKLSSIKFSKSYIILTIIALTIFILGGGIYDIMEQPMSILPTPSNPGYFPDIGYQFLTESISFIFFIIIGIAGGYVSYRSTHHVYRAREAKMFLTIGILMLIVALIGSEVALLSKIR